MYDLRQECGLYSFLDSERVGMPIPGETLSRALPLNG